jgi:hypothetical protein
MSESFREVVHFRFERGDSSINAVEALLVGDDCSICASTILISTELEFIEANALPANGVFECNYLTQQRSEDGSSARLTVVASASHIRERVEDIDVVDEKATASLQPHRNVPRVGGLKHQIAIVDEYFRSVGEI